MMRTRYARRLLRRFSLLLILCLGTTQVAVGDPQRPLSKPALDPKIAADIAEILAANETRKLAEAHLDRGEACLAQLHPEQAIVEFRSVIELFRHPPPTGAPSTAFGTFAAQRIAWSYAAMGDFPEAIAWLDTSIRDYPDWCGFYQASWEVEAETIRRVWRIASLQPGEAEPQLRRLAARQLPWGAEPLTRDKNWNRRLHDVASREASLVLGIYLLKRGQTAPAKTFFAKAAAHPYSKRESWYVLAAGYLRQIRSNQVAQTSP